MSEAPWIKSYPAGVRWDAELHSAGVLGMLDEAVRRWPDHAALSYSGRTFSYRELSGLVDRTAAGLQRLGVGPGVHVGLYLPNVPQYVFAFMGILRAGGTVVNYSPLDAAEVLAHKIEDSQTDILITLDLVSLYPKMSALMGGTRLQALVVGAMGEYGAAPDESQAQLAASDLVSAVQFDAQCLRFAELLDNDGRPQHHPLTDPERSIAVLQYTGGTTGLPKGAMLTHANLAAAVTQVIVTNVDNANLLHHGRERCLAVLPMFHVFAMVCDLLFPLSIGAEIVLEPRFDAGAVLRTIGDRRISCFPGVPTMFTALASHPQVSEYDLRSLKVCASGGAPLPVELMRRFVDLTGCRLTEAWGMTETSACGTFTPTLGQHKAGSCGIPQPGVTIRFLDVEDPARVLPYGERGEIAIAGPNVMPGYWRNDEATRESFTCDGCFRTGDVGYMDEDGYLYIVDRTKDMLLCGGFNVYPRVIEEAIHEHPAVEEVLVIGIPDDFRGESPKAYVKLRAGQPQFTLDELKLFLKNRLGKHEMVHALEFRSELPKTAVGKLSKKMLKDEVEVQSSALAPTP
ncbi:long-chain fatty acid--CoA ligase [Variovorax sp. YR216]|uniref:long-chain-fatty-acid--CoA ligase n=1 Tax=Variovorax sp. YR216 TaxID=1882828 RepID=UPI00089D157C|nr:long-chain fatty acid--CoA ligase [Variovorax sp. YR216]SEB18996.1 long-chain acyl-CoA synthetase [Variovorax sp. YR216]